MTTAQQLQQTMNNFRIIMEKKSKPADDFSSKFGNVSGDKIFFSFIKKSQSKKQATA